MKCIVYNLENRATEPGVESEFFCGVNGEFYRGKCGEVVDLPEEAINVLNSSVIIKTRKINGVISEEKIYRYMVKVLEPMTKVEEVKAPEIQQNEEGKFVCEVCGKDFNSKNALFLHKRIHE